MFCSSCGQSLTPAPGLAPTRCFACGQFTAPAAPTPQQAQQQAAAAGFLADRNNNGIPDVLEGGMSNPYAANPYAPAGGPSPYAPPGLGLGLDLSRVPPAPRQPSARARDLVFGYQGSQGVRRTIGLVFFLFGSVMSTIFCWGIPGDLAIALLGTTVKGTVTGTEILTSVSVNHRHPQVTHFTFRYEGATYESSSSTLSYTSGQPRAGTPVNVELFSLIPSIARLESNTRSSTGYGTLFVLLFPLIGGALALSAFLENRREIRAFLHGTAALARVTYQGPDTSTKVNGRHPYKIEWQLVVGPSVYKGAISHMDRNAIAELAAGGQILVLYDPRAPRINTVYVA
jgi:hypothetical protein